MTQRLRTLAVLPEDLGSIISTHMATHNYLLTLIPGDSQPSLTLYVV